MSKPNHIDRREAVRRLGAAVAVPTVAGLGSALGSSRHPLVPGGNQEPWAPLVFNEHQDHTVVVLAELIIPETDTPGATIAQVNQFIDFELSEGPADERDDFLQGLAWLDRTSRARFGRDFVDLELQTQTELLARLAAPDSSENQIGRVFFRSVKQQTVVGYYTSRVGMRQELGYQGNMFLPRFEGCTHPEHLRWEPSPDRDPEP